jgi:hypothetical protein
MNEHAEPNASLFEGAADVHDAVWPTGYAHRSTT